MSSLLRETTTGERNTITVLCNMTTESGGLPAINRNRQR
jgi:hypothetical protein